MARIFIREKNRRAIGVGVILQEDRPDLRAGFGRADEGYIFTEIARFELPELVTKHMFH